MKVGDVKIRGVTVLGDFLRPDGRGKTGLADRSTTWLFDAVKRQIGLASNLPVDLQTTTASPALRVWVESLRDTAHANSLWASCYDGLPDSSALHQGLERTLLGRLRGRFCVGYEMPPYLTALLDAWSIPYLDVRLHPVRFMDDLMFAVRASHQETQDVLSSRAVAHADVLMTAGLREAMCRMITHSGLPDDTLLVIGQRPLDATQIHDGTFFDAIHHADAIAKICARYRAVLLKPHPCESRHSLLEVACGVAANVLGAVKDNTYRMLAMPQIAGILTVSSSVAYEAGYFGKTVHTLAPLPVRLGWRDEPIAPDMHASLDDFLLAPDFWRLVLAPHAKVTPPDGARLPAKPNRLRIALDSFWNFHEIDTDRIPSGATATHTDEEAAIGATARGGQQAKPVH